jgi:hypothetical protein
MVWSDMKRGVLLLLFVTAWLVCGHAMAADDPYCRNGDFSSEQKTFALGKVIGSGHLDLLSDMNGCPSEGKQCNGLGYVLPGDVVITGREHGAYVCVLYPNRFGGSAGWVEQSRLVPEAFDSSPALQSWVGRWKDGDDLLRLSLYHGQLHADGAAYWPSAHPAKEDAPGGPNVGSLEANAMPTGNRVQFSEGNDLSRCQVTAILVGTWMLVDDNGNCGGMNVRFSGIYQRH